ncbi:MAG: alanine racemase [Deltaproteobacteria bacterium]|nr:MAG: alanine racemase [Deltaproteobacteria bacterium]
MIANKVVIDLGALRHNFFEIKRLVGAEVRIVAVVKSDAYGHGLIPVARVLETAGADCFGVFELNEALELREAGCRLPILIMMGIAQEEASAVVENGLTAAVFQYGIAEKLSEAALKHGTIAPVHVKVDTGMTRLGVPAERTVDFVRLLQPLKGIRLEGVFSHLAQADMPDHPFTEEQIRRFSRVFEACKQLGVCTDAVHISNSGALLGGKGVSFGMVRPGILLYGSSPAEGWPAAASFKPVMTFRSRVIQVKKVPAGTSISYGHTYTTRTSAVIATVPVGYDDGYSRAFSNKGYMLVRGKRVPVVGRVCMNLTMLDVSSVKGVSAGDEVVIIGAQGKERITAEEIAKVAGTISYEIYCSIGKSNYRIYKDSEKTFQR